MLLNFLVSKNFKHSFLKSLDLECGSIELDNKRYCLHNTLVKQQVIDQSQKNKLAKESYKEDKDRKLHKEIYIGLTKPRAYIQSQTK